MYKFVGQYCHLFETLWTKIVIKTFYSQSPPSPFYNTKFSSTQQQWLPQQWRKSMKTKFAKQ